MAGWWTLDRQQYAARYLMRAASLSALGAAGLVSRWANVESTANGPTAVNPRSGAFGIAQWLGSRLPPIKGNTNFDAQLAYAARELNGSEARAGNVLRAANTVADAARGATMYERAEGYNAATGKDNFTARTASGIPQIAALLNTSLPGEVYIASAYTDSPVIDSGSATKSILLGAGALLLLYLYVSR